MRQLRVEAGVVVEVGVEVEVGVGVGVGVGVEVEVEAVVGAEVRAELEGRSRHDNGEGQGMGTTRIQWKSVQCGELGETPSIARVTTLFSWNRGPVCLLELALFPIS